MAKQTQKKEPKKFNIGIICNGFNYSDINYFKEQFQLINTNLPFVNLIFIGYQKEKDDFKIVDNIICQYTNPVSIAHYYKHLKILNLDLMFIPLVRNKFNETSENYNKYLEASVLSIPTMTLSIFPYTAIITNRENGLFYNEENSFFSVLNDLMNNDWELFIYLGKNAKNLVQYNFGYTKENVLELINAID